MTHPTNTQPTTTTTPPAEASVNLKRRVLIVDDEPDFTLMMGLALQQTGRYETREENNALNTVKAACDFRPDVVLLDVMMPEADGGDVAGELKAHPITRDIPIIFLTALVGNEESNLGGLLSGGHRFLPKPVSLAELTETIEEVAQSPGAPA